MKIFKIMAYDVVMKLHGLVRGVGVVAVLPFMVLWVIVYDEPLNWYRDAKRRAEQQTR